MSYSCSPVAYLSLILSQYEGLSAFHHQAILQECSTVEELHGYLHSGKMRRESSYQSTEDWKQALSKAQAIITQARQHQVLLLCLLDDAYPPLLTEIPDPPQVLYVKGCLASHLPSIACIGTRRPTQHGKNLAWRYAAVAAEQGFSIVSGLATGVDAIVHQQALSHGAHTVAVLPCGLEQVYPSHHCALASQILDAGGTLVSEVPFGTPIEPHLFVRRNRIQSGLSLATLFVQGQIRSGTMHTARSAQEQNRPLLVAEPHKNHRNHRGFQGNLSLIVDAKSHPMIHPIASVSSLQSYLHKLPHPSKNRIEPLQKRSFLSCQQPSIQRIRNA